MAKHNMLPPAAVINKLQQFVTMTACIASERTQLVMLGLMLFFCGLQQDEEG